MKRILLLTALSASLQAAAQPAGPIVYSPFIHDDGSVTVRLYAPEARSVSVRGDFLPPETVEAPFGRIEVPGKADLVRDETGIWSLTTQGPVDPEFYTYSFDVDGVRCLDPANAFTVRDGNTLYSSFIVTREAMDRGAIYAPRTDRHGIIEKVWYLSSAFGVERRLTVYLPEGYDGSDRSYPVLYLLHGSGGDEDAWTTLGRADRILDNLIAAGRAEPMIVVMPNGHVTTQAAPGEADLRKPDELPLYGKTPSSMEASFPEIIDFIDAHYRTIRNKKGRAMAGLSMGGGHTFHTTLRNPELFGYIGLFSPYINLGAWNDRRSLAEKMEDDPAFQNQVETLFRADPSVYWIGIGKMDQFYGTTADLRSFLDQNHCPYFYLETSGGHNWSNWRIYLSEFVQVLFKD